MGGNVKTIANVEVSYQTHHQDEINIITESLPRIMRYLDNNWKLTLTRKIKVHIMDSWQESIMKSAPYYFKPLVFIQLILSYRKLQKLWCSIGGWGKAYGSNYYVGVKPIDVLTQSLSEKESSIFLEVMNPSEKLSHILCHELTHAYCEIGKLPTWLYEGIAMVSVDNIFSINTVRPESIRLIQDITLVEQINSSLKVYVFGYWMTKYLISVEGKTVNELINYRNSSNTDFNNYFNEKIVDMLDYYKQ